MAFIKLYSVRQQLVLHFIVGILSQGVWLLVEAIDPSFTTPVCDPSEFYVPYARVLQSRSGPTLKSLHKTGFLDLRSHSGLLCINGPALLYPELASDDSLVTNEDPQIYSHACFTFNRRDPSAYSSPPPLSPISSTTPVYGLRLYGVFLLSAPGDYRGSAFTWFPRPEYNYFPRGPTAVVGASFVAVANCGGDFQTGPSFDAYCFKVVGKQISGELRAEVGVGSTPKLCWRNEEDEEGDFDSVFHLGLPVRDYGTWSGCGVCEDGAGVTNPVIDLSPPNQTFPDFRTVDLSQLLNGAASPGKVFKPKIKQGSIPFYIQQGTEGTDEATASPEEAKVVSGLLLDCEEVPPVSDTCAGANNVGCEILKRVLTIEKLEDATPTTPNPVSFWQWRRPVLNLVTKIYAKICPQVSKKLGPALVQVLEYFVGELAPKAIDPSLTTPPKPENELTPAEAKWEQFKRDGTSWATLIPDLEKCLNASVKMPFYRTKDLKNGRKKKELEEALNELAKDPKKAKEKRAMIEEGLKDIRIRFPYLIYLPAPIWMADKTQLEVPGFVEAAEIDYDLDWGIDTLWKLFSAVLGYCNKHYSLPGDSPTSTHSLLIKRFTEDIMDVVMEQWKGDRDDPAVDQLVIGNFRSVYETLFGEFIHGPASRYIDACNNGAYWWAEVPHFRPVRPLTLKQQGNTSVNNFYVEKPTFK